MLPAGDRAGSASIDIVTRPGLKQIWVQTFKNQKVDFVLLGDSLDKPLNRKLEAQTQSPKPLNLLYLCIVKP